MAYYVNHHEIQYTMPAHLLDKDNTITQVRKIAKKHKLTSTERAKPLNDENDEDEDEDDEDIGEEEEEE